MLAVALGAAIGAVLRWAAGVWVNALWHGFPLGTLLVNCAGGLMIGMALLGPRVDQLEESDAVRRAGMSSYLLPFEIVSVHLLVVLIGAAYLARAKRRPTLAMAMDR